MIDRRRFLALSAAGLATFTVPGPRRARAAVPPGRDPFTLGVASGYPSAGSVVLWTRLAPLPLAPDGGLPPAPVEVHWEVAADEGFRRITASGTTWALPQWAHSVHVEPGGLEPARDYWYRFRAGDARSPAGRTRTATAAGAALARLDIAVASCQHYEQGHYAAYRHLVAAAPDLVLHVGDYIYEGGVGSRGVRRHASQELYALEDYRVRYAQYKLDPLLAAAHAAAPWMLMWDDHEVDNDYAGESSEEQDDPALFLQRRAAAYRAYYEHQPLPRRALPFGPQMRLHAQRAFGDLANVTLLDQRQYRSPLACPRPGRSSGQRLEDCPELALPNRTMLGERQEAWLHGQLMASRAHWNLVGQGTVMQHLDEKPGEGRRYWNDAWNGYPAARQRLVDTLVDTRAANPVVLSGDIHAFLAGTLHARADDPGSAPIAPEFVTTSISTNGMPQEALDGLRGENPALRFADSRHRGYLRLELTPARAQARLIAVDDPLDPGSACRELAGFVVEAGRPELADT